MKKKNGRGINVNRFVGVGVGGITGPIFLPQSPLPRHPLARSTLETCSFYRPWKWWRINFCLQLAVIYFCSLFSFSLLVANQFFSFFFISEMGDVNMALITLRHRRILDRNGRLWTTERYPPYTRDDREANSRAMNVSWVMWRNPEPIIWSRDQKKNIRWKGCIWHYCISLDIFRPWTDGI